ncbi:sigma-70 family RNA polymerase sigma factor [Streptomyces sp. NPDC001388]|uniref:sigma-70 family RNA polymerase sigma factor n=1 Tax=Streptomyces sp. NPDC001388 TaxID=3364568 RepID=UPI0036C29DDD
MPDRSTSAPAQPSVTAAYARIYEEQQPRLVAYARTLTRNAWTAEDLVAEAHFRVWRRLAEGHEIDNVPAYLRTTVRHLAIASGTAVRETPRDPHTDERAEPGTPQGDPAEQVSQVDLVVRVLGQLPERWVKALWLAEAEGQPLAAIGPQLGTKEGATAVLLHRAREGMRQAFLRTQSGAPDDPACQVHWARMPAYVRGAATPRQGERLLGHVDGCADCRARLAALMRANDRLPALVAPALLVCALGGTGKFLPALATGSAGAATAAGAAGGHGAGLLHGVRHAVVGGSKAPAAVAAGALVAGAAAVCLVLGPAESAPTPVQRTPVADAPVTRVPVTGTPVAPPAGAALPAEATGDDRATSAQAADDRGEGAARTGDTSSPPESAPGGTTASAPGDDTSPPAETPPEEEPAAPPADEGDQDGGGQEAPEPSAPAPEPPPAPAPVPGPGNGTGTGTEEPGGDTDPGSGSGSDTTGPDCGTGGGDAGHGEDGVHGKGAGHGKGREGEGRHHRPGHASPLGD